MRGLTVLLTVLLLLLMLSVASVAAETAAPANDSYQQAIRAATEDLGRLEKEDAPLSGGWRLSDLIGLAALLTAVGLVIWATRWSKGSLFRSANGREMRVLDRMAISKTTTLLLVRLRGRDYWLADHAGGVTVLSEQDAADNGANVAGGDANAPGAEGTK